QRTSRCPAFASAVVRTLAAKFSTSVQPTEPAGTISCSSCSSFFFFCCCCCLLVCLLAFSDFLSSVSELALLALLALASSFNSCCCFCRLPVCIALWFAALCLRLPWARKMSRTLLLCTLVAALILTVAAAPSVGDDGWHQRRGGAEPYRFFMLKRLLKRPADDRDIEQLLKQLNDWSSESRSDSVIFRLRRGGGGGRKTLTRKGGKQQARAVGGPASAPCAHGRPSKPRVQPVLQVEQPAGWAAPSQLQTLVIIVKDFPDFYRRLRQHFRFAGWRLGQ
uniref:Rhomboid domain-containing protein n=1 Tax=Macrostomum lignano TaxID=282301 RepID=A0A1I8FL60_9PLAT